MCMKFSYVAIISMQMISFRNWKGGASSITEIRKGSESIFITIISSMWVPSENKYKTQDSVGSFDFPF